VDPKLPYADNTYDVRPVSDAEIVQVINNCGISKHTCINAWH
jgi:hypothetical protein